MPKTVRANSLPLLDLAMRSRSTTLAIVALLAFLSDAATAQTPTSVAAQPPPPAPVSLFAYNRAAPLDYREVATESPNPAVQLFRVSFASPGGGRVTGFLGVPVRRGSHPGVVMLHGLPGTAQGAMANQGSEYAARGAVVLAIDAPWVRRGGLPDLTPRDSVEQVQLMQDLQRAVDVLVARRDVDANRIAYQGGSYGGAMGALFIGIERRLRTAILFVPDGGLVAHFTNANGDPISVLGNQPAGVRERWLAAMRPIEPIEFIARATIPVLLQNGRQDQLVSVEDAEALHAAAPTSRVIKWYDAGHALTPAARADRRAWLVEHVGLEP